MILKAFNLHLVTLETINLSVVAILDPWDRKKLTKVTYLMNIWLSFQTARQLLKT